MCSADVYDQIVNTRAGGRREGAPPRPGFEDNSSPLTVRPKRKSRPALGSGSAERAALAIGGRKRQIDRILEEANKGKR